MARRENLKCNTHYWLRILFLYVWNSQPVPIKRMKSSNIPGNLKSILRKASSSQIPQKEAQKACMALYDMLKEPFGRPCPGGRPVDY